MASPTVLACHVSSGAVKSSRHCVCLTLCQRRSSEILSDRKAKRHVAHGIDFLLVGRCGAYSKPYLLFVGSVKPHKNLSRLLEAFDRLLQKIPHDLIIIGRQEGFITGDALANERASAMHRRVKCVGELDHDHEILRRFYAHADALILPSLYESFGLPALESGCLGMSDCRLSGRGVAGGVWGIGGVLRSI